MTKNNRLQIIIEVSGVKAPTIEHIKHLIDNFILDELKYAGLKAWVKQVNVKDEFNKVLDTYSFTGYSPSPSIINYIKHYSENPEVASMQHVDLNDYVSYIGEYYDGTPTKAYRKKGRYEIKPLHPEWLTAT